MSWPTVNWLRFQFVLRTIFFIHRRSLHRKLPNLRGLKRRPRPKIKRQKSKFELKSWKYSNPQRSMAVDDSSLNWVGKQMGQRWFIDVHPWICQLNFSPFLFIFGIGSFRLLLKCSGGFSLNSNPHANRETETVDKTGSYSLLFVHVGTLWWLEVLLKFF